MKTSIAKSVFERLLSAGEVRTKTEFGERIGIGHSFASQIISGKAQVPSDFKARIRQAFPTLDMDALETKELLTESTATYKTRKADRSKSAFINRYGVRFEPLTDGTWLAHHKKVPQAAHAAAAAGWGDPEYTESLPESTTIVSEPSEDNYATFVVVGDCQDDNTKEAISEGDEVTGRSYPRDMWRYKLPFDPPGAEGEKAAKVRNGKGDVAELSGNKRYRNWVFIDRQHGIHIAIITGQDVEKGILYCSCRNPNKKKYPDFEIHMDDCVQILYVVDLKRNF